MEEILKHINDTNASYRTVGAGDAKNTDLFLCRKALANNTNLYFSFFTFNFSF